jgi:hypothetical protein
VIPESHAADEASWGARGLTSAIDLRTDGTGRHPVGLGDDPPGSILTPDALGALGQAEPSSTGSRRMAREQGLPAHHQPSPRALYL